MIKVNRSPKMYGLIMLRKDQPEPDGLVSNNELKTLRMVRRFSLLEGESRLYNNSWAEVALRLPATGNELDILDGE